MTRKPLPTGEALQLRADELGVNKLGPVEMINSAQFLQPVDDHELQRRVIEAERALRESKLWIVALVSAVASVLSAVVAIIAVASS